MWIFSSYSISSLWAFFEQSMALALNAIMAQIRSQNEEEEEEEEEEDMMEGVEEENPVEEPEEFIEN